MSNSISLTWRFGRKEFSITGPGLAYFWPNNIIVFMTFDQVNKQIKACAQQMDARYGKVVFDEWAIVSLADQKGRLLSYIGPRKDGFQKNFLNDAGSLRAGLLTKQYDPGDFEFSRHEVGTGFESFMVLGKGMYLICNNTVQSMDAITK